MDTLYARLVESIDLGGPIVAVLLVMSVIALTIILVKLWQFAALRVGARRFAFRALAQWDKGERAQALKLLARCRGPVARVLEVAMRGQQARADEPTLREEVGRLASVQLENLRGYLRALEVIASLSPLLGLLGTVQGMIQAFQKLEQAGSQVDTAILSGGIWTALLTTAVGLGVAIPVVIALKERCGHFMEDVVTRVFTHPARVPAARPEPAYGHAA